jgi:putative CocE/NonD family hydrolase
VRFPVLCALFILGSPLSAPAQQPSPFERDELTIPMRDGVKLHAVALVPTGTRQPLPILLIRTPFGADREFRSDTLPPRYRELAEDGYIFVTEDIRGRFKSEGEFVTTRAQNDPRSPRGINESTDAYDTIDWLVKNLAGNNGKVGVLGISYRGWLAALAGVNPHPAVKAISPQGLVADTWMGDDFFHQGAFRQTQGLAYTAWVESEKGFEIQDADQYDFYLRYPTLDSLARATGIRDVGSWAGFSTHPAWDRYWQGMALQNVLTRPDVPLLFVGGWWDAEDILGPQLMYGTVEQADRQQRNRIAMGPWFHGEWGGPGVDSLGPVSLGSNTTEYFRRNIQRPWLAWYLHDRGDGGFPEAWLFETGGNQWRTFDRWPPRQAKERKLYLGSDHRLSFDPPRSTAVAYDAFISDPANPVPFMPRPITDDGWARWMVQDQGFVRGRPDVLTWVSDELEQDLVIAGDVAAHLFASTSGSDADWVVKLIDLFPGSAGSDGYALMVNGDIMRGRYWKGWSTATPIPAHTVTPFTIDLHQQLYRFRKGHRLMVQVQSSWFPLYDRNPQTFVPNIFLASPSAFVAREHRIWHTPRFPSHLTVRVLDD